MNQLMQNCEHIMALEAVTSAVSQAEVTFHIAWDLTLDGV